MGPRQASPVTNRDRTGVPMNFVVLVVASSLLTFVVQQVSISGRSPCKFRSTVWA